MTTEDYNNDWRKLTAVIYQKPRDSKIFGSVEFDVTDVEPYVNAHRRNKSKITLTHVFLLAFARALREDASAINCYVRRGKIIKRDHVDVSLTVLARNGQLSAVRVPNADQMTMQELCAFLESEINKTRNGQDQQIQKAKNVLLRLPWPLRQWMADFYRWWTIELGFSIPFTGVKPDSFGSFVLSNIGSIGLDVGYPALAPFSNVSMVVLQGSVSSKPAVVEGQIVPRRMITFSAALDHRVVDAAQIGRLFNYIRRVLKKPEMLETL